MPFDQRGLNDYVDVAQRIADFRERYPDGCLQPYAPGTPFEVREVTGVTKEGKSFTATFIVYTAAAYRNPEDPRPGIGCAWEPFPGRTPYTLGSELMNAETSAWGRAIVAVLASDSKRGIASREEVRNRNAEHVLDQPAKKPRERPPARAAGELPRNRDGSLSRSRATSEELAAVGAMSDEQLREHNALEREVLGTGADGKVRQHQQRAEDPGDLFLTPAPDGPVSPPEHVNPQGERLVDPDKAKAAVRAFRAVGMVVREDIMEAMDLLLDRDVPLADDLSDMTEDEADHLFTELAGVADLDALQVLLAAQREAVGG